MAKTYEINEFNEIVPYDNGRINNDTNSWRNATELELTQQNYIKELEDKIKELEDKV